MTWQNQLSVQKVLNRLFSSSCGDRAVRVRFAPSPTGYLHLGGLRTALFNYLFAQSNNGTFILRVEDTDQTRKVVGAIEKLEYDLNWAGIAIDEGPNQGGDYGPYVQSQRLDIYNKEVSTLIANGHAYHCFCSDRRLDIIRKDALRRREIPKYDNRCRNLGQDELHDKLSSGMPYCIRFKLSPLTKPWHDIIHGPILRNICEIEGDPVILKSDGYPTYHLANVVDDHFMQISHVLRGLEWQTSTPKHILLYQAFGWDVPKFAHLPLLVNEDGSKLSKRHSDVTVEAYRKARIYPKTLINVMTVCGGGFIDRENPDETKHLYSIEELKDKFSLAKVNPYSCQLPLRKVKDFNLMELRKIISTKQGMLKILEDAQEIIIEAVPEAKSTLNKERLKLVLTWSIREGRISSLPQLVSNDFIFLWKHPSIDSLAEFDTTLFELIPLLIEYMKISDEIQHAPSLDFIKKISEEKKLPYSQTMRFLRTCLSGLKNGPSVWEIIFQLGKKEVISRLELSLKKKIIK